MTGICEESDYNIDDGDDDDDDDLSDLEGAASTRKCRDELRRFWELWSNLH